MNQLASLLVDAMRALLQAMTADRDEVVISQRACGRPRLNIEEEQIQFLVESNFRIVDIAAMFGCSSSTVQRRQREYRIRSSDFSTLSDAELDELVGSVILLHPQCGERSVTGYSGVKVTAFRGREYDNVFVVLIHLV